MIKKIPGFIYNNSIIVASQLHLNTDLYNIQQLRESQNILCNPFKTSVVVWDGQRTEVVVVVAVNMASNCRESATQDSHSMRMQGMRNWQLRLPWTRQQSTKDPRLKKSRDQSVWSRHTQWPRASEGGNDMRRLRDARALNARDGGTWSRPSWSRPLVLELEPDMLPSSRGNRICRRTACHALWS